MSQESAAGVLQQKLLEGAAEALQAELAAKKKELQDRQEELDAVWTMATHERDRRVALQQQNAALQRENAALRRALGPFAAAEAEAAADPVMEMVAEAVEAAEMVAEALQREPEPVRGTGELRRATTAVSDDDTDADDDDENGGVYGDDV